MTVHPRFMPIADLLLGAVYADDRLDGAEDAAVRKLLCEAVGADELPVELEARIANFEPKEFDVVATAKEFEASVTLDKRKLLELVAGVFDADGEVDFAEDDYLRSLAEALGVAEAEWNDLAIQYDVEDIAAIVDVIVAPPLPET